MDFLISLLDSIRHLDQSLLEIVAEYGTLTYGLLFAVVFCETGLVVTPFLPGDSLLFAAGAIAGLGHLDILVLAGLLSLAAVAGDSLNYAIGSTVASRWLVRSRLVDRRHLERTERFYRRHGGKAILLARFAPILRTFVPFVAGIARMELAKFLSFNVVGGLLWVAAFSFGGYFFGSLPWVKGHFGAIVAGIIAVSLLPTLFAWRPSPRSLLVRESGGTDG